MTKINIIVVEDEVHADLLLLKAIHGHKTLSDTIRYEMSLAKHDRPFFAYMRNKQGEKAE